MMNRDRDYQQEPWQKESWGPVLEVLMLRSNYATSQMWIFIISRHLIERKDSLKTEVNALVFQEGAHPINA